MRFKLITPPGLLLTTALLAIYSVYAFMIGSIEDSTPLLVGCALSVAATYGVAMMRPWSRFLVYLLSAGFIAKLVLSIRDGLRSGYFELHFESGADALHSQAPAMLMVVLSVACCVLVRRHFRLARAGAEK